MSQTIATLANMAFRRWRIRRALGQVHSLDDRTLADIGVARSEIARGVWHGRAIDEIGGC